MMNPLKFEETMNRLKTRQEEAEIFHEKLVKELEDQRLFTVYTDKLTLGKIELSKGYERFLTQSYVLFKGKDEVRQDVISYSWTPEFLSVSLRQNFEPEEEEYVYSKNLLFFFATKLIKQGQQNDVPIIHLKYPATETENLFSFIQMHSNYEFTEESYNSNMVLVKLKKEKPDFSPVTREELLSALQSLIENKYSIETNESVSDAGFIKTNASPTRVVIEDYGKNQILFSGLQPMAKEKMKHLYEKTKNKNAITMLTLSSTPGERAEELEAVFLILFNDLMDDTMSIWELSSDVRYLIERYLHNRFHDVRHLPQKQDHHGNVLSIHPELVNHLLSGTWKEHDNHRSHLLLWLNALTVVKANAFGFIAHYDGSVDGLKEEAYILFHYIDSSDVLKGRNYNPVYYSLEEALFEMELLNDEIISKWNKR